MGAGCLGGPGAPGQNPHRTGRRQVWSGPLQTLNNFLGVQVLLEVPSPPWASVSPSVRCLPGRALLGLVGGHQDLKAQLQLMLGHSCLVQPKPQNLLNWPNWAGMAAQRLDSSSQRAGASLGLWASGLWPLQRMPSNLVPLCPVSRVTSWSREPPSLSLYPQMGGVDPAPLLLRTSAPSGPRPWGVSQGRRMPHCVHSAWRDTCAHTCLSLGYSCPLDAEQGWSPGLTDPGQLFSPRSRTGWADAGQPWTEGDPAEVSVCVGVSGVETRCPVRLSWPLAFGGVGVRSGSSSRSPCPCLLGCAV